MYYTPEELTRIIDPTAGSGAFLKAAYALLVNPPFMNMSLNEVVNRHRPSRKFDWRLFWKIQLVKWVVLAILILWRVLTL